MLQLLAYSMGDWTTDYIMYYRSINVISMEKKDGEQFGLSSRPMPDSKLLYIGLV
jgi:hypothetical protein